MGFGIDGQYFDDEMSYLSQKTDAISIRTAPQGPTEATGALKSSGGTETPQIPDFTNERPHDWVERAAMGIGNAAVSGFTLPGDVLSGKVQAGSVQEIERAADLAGLMVAGPAPVASKMADGTLGSFAGVGAKTVNKTKLYEAQEMESAGIHPDEVWQSSGFFRGADNRWRYEIPDAPAKIKDSAFDVTIHQGLPSENPSWHNLTGTESVVTHTVKDSPRDAFGKVKPNTAIRLPDVLDHPELYQAYPSLTKTKVQPLPQHLVDRNVKGQFDPSNNTIYLAPDLNSDYIKSVLLHESQHHIQEVEGFAKGGDSVEFLHPNLAKAEQIYKDAIAKGGDPNSPALTRAKKILQDVRDEAFENYMRLMGETEARNVQARMNFNQAKRRYNTPRSTEDRPRFSQIGNEGEFGPVK